MTYFAEKVGINRHF